MYGSVLCEDACGSGVLQFLPVANAHRRMQCNYQMECSSSLICLFLCGQSLLFPEHTGSAEDKSLLFYEPLPLHQQTAIKVWPDLAPAGAADS